MNNISPDNGVDLVQDSLEKSTPILNCRHLAKSYDNYSDVLKDFSLEVQPGRIFGLLGPNGCGKSTLMKLITGLLVPDSGSIEICGIPRSEETNSLVSYLPERTYFNSTMYVNELIKFFSDFYSDFDTQTAERLLADLGISQSARLKTLSKGMKEKVQLIMVMSRKTRLYLLDEPIGGVDPAAREYILDTIIGNYQRDASVIITTHLISDIEPVLNDFAFMNFGGEILRAGSAEAAREEFGMSLDEQFREVFKCYSRL